MEAIETEIVVEEFIMRNAEELILHANSSNRFKIN